MLYFNSAIRAFVVMASQHRPHHYLNHLFGPLRFLLPPIGSAKIIFACLIIVQRNSVGKFLERNAACWRGHQHHRVIPAGILLHEE